MEVSILNQLFDFVLSMLMGVFLGFASSIAGAVQNLFGIFEVESFGKLADINFSNIENPLKKKKSIKYQRIILFFIDILYFIFATISLMIFIYYINDGIVRWYILLGNVLGCFLYKLSFGKIIAFLIGLLVFLLKVIILKLLCPLKTLFGKMKIFSVKILALIRKKLMKKRKKKSVQKQRTEMLKIGK